MRRNRTQKTSRETPGVASQYFVGSRGDGDGPLKRTRVPNLLIKHMPSDGYPIHFAPL